MAVMAAYKWVSKANRDGGAGAAAPKAYFIGTPQRANTPRKSRIGGKISLFQSAPCAS
jgi:hypothetical protein